MRGKWRILALFGCLFLGLMCLGTTAMAEEKVLEEMSLEEVFSLSLEDLMNVTTTTSTRRETTTNKAPATMTLITEAEIKRSGARDLKELLDRMPGYTYWEYFMTKWSGQSFRGIASNSNKVKFLLNGHEVATPFWKVHWKKRARNLGPRSVIGLTSQNPPHLFLIHHPCLTRARHTSLPRKSHWSITCTAWTDTLDR